MADNSDKIALLNKLLQEGKITQEMFNDNVKKLQTLKTNLRPDMPERASNLSDVINKIKERGVGIQNITDEVKAATPGTASVSGRTALMDTVGSLSKESNLPKTTSLQRLNSPSKLGRTLKALGILAPGIAAMGIGEKAMAGDFGGAGIDAADLATDYVPGVGQVKDIIRPEEMGNSELPFEEMQARRIFNEQMRKGKSGEPTRHPSFTNEKISTESPVSEEELNKEIRKKFDVFSKMK